MDNVINRAIYSIDQSLETLPIDDSHYKPRLIVTRNLLNRLIDSNSSKNEWTQVFCHQLNRLMDYNETLFREFWIDLRDDIIYLLEEPDSEQGKSEDWYRFLKKMRLEDERIQCQLQFQQTFGNRKTLNQLFCKHQKFFEEYLHKCISLHSTMQVRGLIENLDNFLCEDYAVIETLFTQNNERCLEEKLKCIDITFDCSTRSLEIVDLHFAQDADPYKTSNQSFNNFLPSGKTQFKRWNNFSTIGTTLESYRWIVILGDPGSAKSTLLRWITFIFAEAIRLGNEEVTLEGFYKGVVRIPILIRIGEFAVWLDQHKNETLIDYIGQHTWFLQSYTQNDKGNALKELIYHGHALILLDGLDEIPEVGRREAIVDHVRRFINEYVRASDYYSAFADKMSYDSYFRELVETLPPSEAGGNQIIITSRIVGYQFYPIVGPFIHHYFLSLMDHEEAREFIKRWIREVEKGIHNVLLNEGIQLDKERMNSLSNKRSHAIQCMFENNSSLLKSNPALLSLICIFIFQSPNEFHPQTRIEVYHHAVQSVLRSWTTHQSSISKDFIITFLINLSTYLHLYSPSGLIDAYDMKQFCRLILWQQGVSNDRVKLSEYANKMALLLESNMGIVAELGLEVFGFQHLSFQEYFVSQSFIKNASIEVMVKRILTFAMNSRFRESLLLALGWISWKWSWNDYNKFCNLLVTYDKTYAIPAGTLLFFDALNDLQRLPSNSVIFNALNSLLDYPFYFIVEKYLIWNLSKLPKNIIIEWMQLRLKDEKCLFKFCGCFLAIFDFDARPTHVNSKFIYQQLTSFRTISTAAQFVIDQTLRRIMMSEHALTKVLTDEFFSYFLPKKICTADIHPLIFSVIIVVCGGMSFDQNLDNKMTLRFSSKHMHIQSSVTSSIITYLTNHQDSHSIKIELLIKQYENILEKASQSETSTDVVDTFIALICLKGLSKPFVYEKYHGYQALSLALMRLKQTWFYLKQSCNPETYRPITIDRSSMISEVESIMNMFFTQFVQSNEECLKFSLACAGALNKLDIECSSVLFTSNLCLPDNIARYFEYQSEFSHSDIERKFKEMIQSTHPMQMLQHEPCFLLTFVSQSLQNLYYYLIIDPINKKNSLPLVALLSQCLMLLEDVDRTNPDFYLALSMLQLQFKEHMLENYIFVLFWENNFDHNYKYQRQIRDVFVQMMKDHMISVQLSIDQPKDWQMLINMECQRISDVKNAQQTQEKDCRLFAASITLARLFQAQYRTRTTENISLSIVESDEVYFAIINILDPVLRILALSTILDMKDPLIFDQERRDQLQWEMIYLLQSQLTYLPLRTATLLFVRCHSIHQFFPKPFQEMSTIIADKFNETSNDTECQNEEAVFIALRQLNNPQLSHCLFQFVKRKENLSDLLQFNSTIFFRYFTTTTSFRSSHSILLSLMYLIELAFDVQILQMYTNNRFSPLKELDQLWGDLSKTDYIMTHQVALCITNYLQMSNKEKLQKIVEDTFRCSMIERKALSIIEKWLDYRMDKDLRYFAYYAALQLVAEGSNLLYLIDIINEMFDIDGKFHFKSLIERLFNSELVNLSVLRQILIKLHEHAHFSRKISVWISLKEAFQLILHLEFERISSNVHQSSAISSIPFLLIIKGCSHDLQLYFVEHLHTFINDQTEIRNTFKEEYLAVLIKWIIESSVWRNKKEMFSEKLYDCIFIFLHNHHFLQVQKAVINGLNSVFIRYKAPGNHVFFQDNTIAHLEEIIRSFDKYSEDIVAASLLAYGNYLYMLRNCKMSRTISNEIRTSLNILFETSVSKIIAIRLALCFIFAQKPSATPTRISQFLRKKWILTPEDKYNTLLQKTLYEREYTLFKKYDNATEIAHHIEAHSVELLDTFVLNLHDHLYDKCTNDYLSDPAPNYALIACKAIEKNFNMFHKPIQKCIFDQDKWKEAFLRHLYHKKDQSYDEALAKLYAMDGVLRVELIEIYKWFENVHMPPYNIYFGGIKQVSNRLVINKLYELIHLMICNGEFAFCDSLLDVLDRLARSHVVSSYELHQQISVIMNNLPQELDDKDSMRYRRIFSSLLNHSCIETVTSPLEKVKLFTESEIDENFERATRSLEKKSNLFLRRNYFFTILRTSSDCTNQRPRNRRRPVKMLRRGIRKRFGVRKKK